MKEVNKEKEFERLLKEKADRFEMKPAPEVWQQVQDTVQKDRRRRFAWWLMAALLFAVLGTGAFFMLEKKSYPPVTPPTAENNADRSNAVNNSSSETNESGKNPSSGSTNDHISRAQNQSADITSSKNKEEKTLKDKSQDESNSVPSLAQSEPAEGMPLLIPPMSGQQEENEGSDSIALLSLKQFPLSLSEVSIQEFPFQHTSLDISSIPSSKHSFCFEADAMALKSFVWNHAAFTPKSNTSAFTVTSYNSSYSFTKGYSAGGNFFFQLNNKWILGAGAHVSKTHLEDIIAQQTVPRYDSVGTLNDYTGMIEYTFDTVWVNATQSQHVISQWLDISLMTGVKLFPDSKNHLRILAGMGYSRLLSNEISTQQTPGTNFDVGFSAGPNPSNVVNNPLPTYRKNQFQLFSEIAYQRDLTSRLSFTTGMQLHYYPMTLITSNELSQHMMWLGLKGGLLFRL